MNIFAETFRIVTRSDIRRPSRHETRHPPFRPLAEEDKWFWQGRRWEPPAGR